MAIIELTKEKEPKLAVRVNNGLHYLNKDEEFKDRTREATLIAVVKQASELAKADKGSVLISLDTANEYKNYFVNHNKQDDIVLTPVDEKLRGDKNNYLFFNKNISIDNPDKYFYTIDKSKSAKKLVDSIKLTQVYKAKYLNVRVTLKNDALQAKLLKGKNLVAYIGEYITTVYTEEKFEAKKKEKQEQRKALQEQNKQEQNKDIIPLEIQDKQGNVIEQTTISKASSYIPKAEQKTQTQQQEFSR